jgi:hypothetical protein
MGDLVEDLAAIDELAELEDQHAGSLAIGEKHAEALILIEHGFELTNVRRGLDDDLTRHPHRELDHLPKSFRRAREEREPAHARPIEATAHVVLDALQVASHGPRVISVELGPRSAQQKVEFVQVVLVPRESPSVDIEVTAGHGSVAPPVSGKGANSVRRERWHDTSWAGTEAGVTLGA